MKNYNYSKNKHCKCGKLIHNKSNNCQSCSAKERLRIPENNPMYKNGLPKCIDCKKILTNYHTIRCIKCYKKFIKNNHTSLYLKRPKCKICKKQLKYLHIKYCKKCYHKIILKKTGKQSNHWKGGKNTTEYINRQKENMKKYRIKNINKIKKLNKNWRKRNIKWLKKYKKYNREKINKQASKWIKNKLNTDLNYKILHSLRIRLYRALKQNWKSGHTLKLLGCSIKQLKNYISKKFKKGMNWNNRGRGWKNKGLKEWHIDHIKPCASFDLSKPEEQAKCFHYTNLQPLWAKDNLSKGNKYGKY